MPTILIRQVPDDYAEATGLAKHQRSRMPGCTDRFAAALNTDGRYVTGLDEESYLVKPEEREEIKKTRESLEKLTGKNLSGVSDFWEDFYVMINSDKPRIFNTGNPLDVISFKLLVANCNVAPDIDSISKAQYRDAQYYAYTEEEESREEMSTRKKRDKAISELLSIEENKDKLVLYGQYLEGLKYTDRLSHNTLYKMLRIFIEDKNIKNTENFLTALKLSPEQLQQKILVDKALKQRLVTKVNLGNKRFNYQFGNVTVGNTVEEVYVNLAKLEFAPELMSIKKELERR